MKIRLYRRVLHTDWKFTQNENCTKYQISVENLHSKLNNRKWNSVEPVYKILALELHSNSIQYWNCTRNRINIKTLLKVESVSKLYWMSNTEVYSESNQHRNWPQSRISVKMQNKSNQCSYWNIDWKYNQRTSQCEDCGVEFSVETVLDIESVSKMHSKSKILYSV